MNDFKQKDMWQLFKSKRDKSSRSSTGNGRQDRLARKIADRIVRTRKCIVERLERFDRRLTQRQRKRVFYLSMLVWSGCMLYILGNAVRKPPAPFILPLYDSASMVQRKVADSLMGQDHRIHQLNIQQNKQKNNGKN